MTKTDQNTFTYRFSNVQKNTAFKLYSSEVESPDFTLEVLKKPNILGFDVKLDYPKYTLRKDEDLAKQIAVMQKMLITLFNVTKSTQQENISNDNAIQKLSEISNGQNISANGDQ